MFIRRHLLGRELFIIINNYLINQNYRISKIKDDSGLEDLKKKFFCKRKIFLIAFCLQEIRNRLAQIC